MDKETKYYDYAPLEEVLEALTVHQLRECALTLGYKFSSGGKKAQIVDALAKIMLDHPEQILKCAFYHELKAWLEIAEGKKTSKDAEEEGYLWEFNRFGLVYSYRNTPYLVHFQKDIADKLIPLIPAELDRREKDGSLVMEKLSFGCANIYGYTDFDRILEYDSELEKLPGVKFDENFINRALYPFICISQRGRDHHYEPIMSPFAQFVDFKIGPEYVNFEIEAKRYDIETVLGFGEMPYPKFPKRCTAKFQESLAKYRKDDTPFEVQTRRLWLYKQNPATGSGIPNFNDFFSVDSFEAVQPALDSVMTFLNNVPYWRLRGNSSEEIGRKEMAKMRIEGRMPKIVTGPNMCAMGIHSFEQIQEMAKRGEDFPPFQSAPSKKVGRNEPCPCGSGKKYKNCCGR